MSTASVRPVIGVLALQGDFQAHQRAVEASGGESVDVRTALDLDWIDGLIIPGGESTTMLKLLHEENLFDALREFGQRKPVFGTCAGTILLAADVTHPRQDSLGLMDLTVERNGYGRQIDSRIVQLELQGHPLEAVFIRAPIIRRAGEAVNTLLSYQSSPVLVEQGIHMAATFHPELTRDNRIHKHFISKVIDSSLVKNRDRKNPAPTLACCTES
jgi:pyridoxal 5'-phosphate synthase pdxT subunit